MSHPGPIPCRDVTPWPGGSMCQHTAARLASRRRITFGRARAPRAVRTAAARYVRPSRGP
eukprot:5194877-Prymnesium_polylepis.1